MSWEKIDISKGWLPDYIDFGIPDGGLKKCKNLLPLNEYYNSFPGILDHSSSTISGSARGCYNHLINNAAYPVIGTTTKLYRLNADKTLTDKSKTATTYACGENQWQFTSYGAWVIATNYVDSVQKHTDISHVSNLFVDLGGTPPKAKYCLLDNGHLILGYCYDSAEYPNRLAWSGFENLETYTPDLDTGADYQDFPDVECINGLIRLGSNFAILHNNSVSLGSYIGSPYTFSFQYNKIKNIGGIRYSGISIGDYALFLSKKGIFALSSDGIVNIGEGVNKYIINNINLNYDYLIRTVHSPVDNLVYWFYPSTSSTTIDKVLIYNYIAKKFAYAEIPFEMAFIMRGSSLTLEDLDASYPSLDDMPYSLDSSRFLSSSELIGGINPSTSKVGILSGSSLSWEIETKELNVIGSTIDIEGIRPKVNISTQDIEGRIGYRNKEDESLDYSDWNTTNTDTGIIDVRNCDRFITVGLKGSNETKIQEIEVDIYKAGEL